MFYYAAIYSIYFALCVGLFGFLKRDCRVPLVWIGGWLLMPVTFYPDFIAEETGFPYWIVGLSLPSDLWPNKLWTVSVTTLLCLILYEWDRIKQLRPCVWDAFLLAWCFWPVVQWSVGLDAAPKVWQSILILLGVWGAPWMIGRVIICCAQDATSFLRWMVVITSCLVPLALVEWLIQPILYGVVWWESHPFRFDGAERYLGFRPLLFFEHGNQYGLWICMVSVIGIWFLKSKQPLLLFRNAFLQRYGDPFLVGLISIVAILSQSVGAIVLMLLVTCYLLVLPRVHSKYVLAATGILLIIGGVLYLSNTIPFRKLATETKFGRKVVDSIRKSGRGSFSWRISQDQRALPLIRDHWMIGTAKWDWWRELNTRPWGYFVLLLGQFGAVGATLNLLVLLGTSLKTLLRWRQNSVWCVNQVGVLCAAIVVFSSLDGLMNAFLFAPATVLAAGLVRLSVSGSS